MTKDQNETKWYQKVFGILAAISVFIIGPQGIIFVWIHKADRKYLMAITFDLSCVVIMTLGFFKVYVVIYRYKDSLIEAIDDIRSLYPTSSQDQKKFEIAKYLATFNIQILVYQLNQSILISLFNFLPIATSAYNFLVVDGKFERNLPYYFWFPFGFDGSEPIVYEVWYILSSSGAFLCAFIVLAVDSVYCILVTLVCMEFEILAKKFEEFGVGSHKSKTQLALLIKEHYKLLG